MKPRAITLLATGCALLTASCVSTIQRNLAGTVGDWYRVTANQTAFYKFGPQQGNGPDEQLSRDTIMKVIRPSFGYVKVQLQDGQDGYVANEDIDPAPHALVSEKLAPPEPTPPVLAAHTEQQFDLNSSDPRLIAPPEPLPETNPEFEPSPLPQPSPE